MIVSELIAELTKLKEMYGDVQVGKMYTTKDNMYIVKQPKAVRHVEPRGGLLCNLLTVEHDIFRKKDGSPIYDQQPIDDLSVELFSMDTNYIIVV